MLVWRKLASAKWEDAWMERLAFLDPARLAVFAFGKAKTIRIEAYDLEKNVADQLVERFGGQLRVLKKRDFVSEKNISSRSARPPLLIRDKLAIVRSEAEREKCARKLPKRKVLVIPAAMAFGTGDHATTATCLRMLCDVTAEKNRERIAIQNAAEKQLAECQRGVLDDSIDWPCFTGDWHMLDLGTGSGILAIAACALGAFCVSAFDFDPACVRTARENAAANRTDIFELKQLDVLKWKPDGETWEVITANLYSEVLIAAAPNISRALKAGGSLILSGILREQENDCVRVFKKQPHLQIDQIIRRGKWVTILARKCRA